jgi:hypothetical protein
MGGGNRCNRFACLPETRRAAARKRFESASTWNSHGYTLRMRQKGSDGVGGYHRDECPSPPFAFMAAAGSALIGWNCCDRNCISFSSGGEGWAISSSGRTGSENMSFSGRYPEHDICENFNAIDVRELQRKTGLRPGLCLIKEWVRNGAPAGEVFIFTQPDAIILVHRARPPGATESRIVELQVPIIWTKCRFGGRRPWFKCLTITNGEVCGRRVAKLYAPCFECRQCMGLGYASQREIPLRRAGRRAQMIKMRLGREMKPGPVPEFRGEMAAALA